MEDHVFVKEKQEKVDFSMPECDVTLALRSDKCDSRKTSCVPETNTTTWSFPFRGSYFSCVLWGILLHEFWLCGAFGIVGDVYTDLVTTYPKYAKDRYVEIQFTSTKKVVVEKEKKYLDESRRNTIFLNKKQDSLLFLGLIREAILQEKFSFEHSSKNLWPPTPIRLSIMWWFFLKEF